jgi:hypothetical protein
MLTGVWLPKVSAEPGRPVATVENGRIRVACDLRTGTFDVVDKLAAETLLQGGHAGVGDWSTAETNRTRHARLTTALDELGRARRLKATARVEPFPGSGELAVLKLDAADSETVEWQVAFQGGN